MKHILKRAALALGAALLLATAPALQAQSPGAPIAPSAATQPAAAVATPKAPAAAGHAVDNPYGLGALWEGGDFVAKTTLAILLIMSMGTWYVIATKLFE